MQSRLTFISQAFWPEEVATAEMLSGVIFPMGERGHEISVIASKPVHRNQDMEVPRKQTVRGVRIVRAWSSRLNKNRALGRIINSLSFSLTSLLCALTTKNPGTYVAVTNPPLLVWQAYLVSLLRRRPFILVIHDLYPQVATAIGKIRADSLIDRVWCWLNRRALRRASSIIVLGRCSRDLVASQLPEGQKDKIVVIPSFANGTTIRPLDRDNHSLLKEWGMADNFVVQYSGNIGLIHDVETIARAARQLRDRQDIKFVFIGDGGQLAWLKDFSTSEGLTNIAFFPYQRASDIPLSLTACDLSIVSLKKEASGCSVPSKLYGILAAGKPVVVVGSKEIETSRTVLEHRCGMVVEPGDSEGFARTILDLSKDRELVRQMGENARRAFEDNFSLDIVARQYEALFQNLDQAREK